MAASDLVAAESGSCFAIHPSSGTVFVRDLVTPAKNFSGTIAAWNAGMATDLGTDGIVDFNDDFKILKTAIPADTKCLIVRLSYTPGGIVGTFDVLLNVYDSTGVQVACGIGVENADLARRSITASFNDGTSRGRNMGQFRDLAADGATVSIAASWDADSSSVSINGEPTSYDSRISAAPLWDTISIKPGNLTNSTILIERIVGLSRKPSSTELANMQGAASLHPYVVSSMTMGDSHSTATTGTERMPSLVNLGVSNGVASILGFHHQRDLDGVMGEDPLHMMQQALSFDGTTLSSSASRSVLSYEDPEFNFSAGYGWVAAPQTVRRTYGDYAGRLFQVFERIPGGRPVLPYERDIMFRYSDDDGASWSTPVTILDASEEFGADSIVVTGSCGVGVEFPAPGGSMPGSIYTNRLAFPINNYTGGTVGVVYTDDDGATWGYSLRGGFPETPNETTIALTADGTMVLTVRVESQNTRYFLTSNDGGETFTAPAAMPSFIGTNVAATMTQLDPGGHLGDWGRLVLARCTRNGPQSRDGVLMSFYEDATLTPLSETYYLARMREYGYVGALSQVNIAGTTYYLVAVESHCAGFNTTASSHIVAVRGLPDPAPRPRNSRRCRTDYGMRRC